MLQLKCLFGIHCNWWWQVNHPSYIHRKFKVKLNTSRADTQPKLSDTCWLYVQHNLVQITSVKFDEDPQTNTEKVKTSRAATLQKSLKPNIAMTCKLDLPLITPVKFGGNQTSRINKWLLNKISYQDKGCNSTKNILMKYTSELATQESCKVWSNSGELCLQTLILEKDLGQSPVQSAQILTACGKDNA